MCILLNLITDGNKKGLPRNQQHFFSKYTQSKSLKLSARNNIDCMSTKSVILKLILFACLKKETGLTVSFVIN